VVWANGSPGVIAWMNAMDPLVPTAWTGATLLNSWVNFGAPDQGARYRKIGGVVYLQGLIRSGTATAGTIVLTLPAGFRPAATLVFATFNASGATRLDVDASGNVSGPLGLVATYTTLSGIQFPADA
jgi:hypothetical protein